MEDSKEWGAPQLSGGSAAPETRAPFAAVNNGTAIRASDLDDHGAP
jgi:hypothetical protein